MEPHRTTQKFEESEGPTEFGPRLIARMTRARWREWMGGSFTTARIARLFTAGFIFLFVVAAFPVAPLRRLSRSFHVPQMPGAQTLLAASATSSVPRPASPSSDDGNESPTGEDDDLFKPVSKLIDGKAFAAQIRAEVSFQTIQTQRSYLNCSTPPDYCCRPRADKRIRGKRSTCRPRTCGCSR